MLEFSDAEVGAFQYLCHSANEGIAEKTTRVCPTEHIQVLQSVTMARSQHAYLIDKAAHPQQQPAGHQSV